MDELIQQLTAQLGIDASTAKKAVGTVLSLLQSEGGEELFSKISAAIPGAASAAEETASPTESGGPAGILGTVAGMLGGSAGKGFALASALKSIGVDEQDLAKFAGIVVDFLKQRLGPETVDQLLGKLPMLKSLLG